MNWQAVIQALNIEAKELSERLCRKIVSKETQKVLGFVIQGEQRQIDLQTIQLCIILAKALQNGLQQPYASGESQSRLTDNGPYAK